MAADPIDWPSKSPAEVLNYTFNWSPRQLDEAEITSIDAQIMAGDVEVVISSVSDDVRGAKPGQGTVHRLSGGTDGTECGILLTATTDSGDTLEQTMRILIEQK